MRVGGRVERRASLKFAIPVDVEEVVVVVVREHIVHTILPHRKREKMADFVLSFTFRHSTFLIVRH